MWTVERPTINTGWAHVVGPGSAQPMYLGLTRPISKKIQKYLFQNFTIFPCSFYVILINIRQYFMS
jgi:hypothetical protein